MPACKPTTATSTPGTPTRAVTPSTLQAPDMPESPGTPGTQPYEIDEDPDAQVDVPMDDDDCDEDAYDHDDDDAMDGSEDEDGQDDDDENQPQDDDDDEPQDDEEHAEEDEDHAEEDDDDGAGDDQDEDDDEDDDDEGEDKRPENHVLVARRAMKEALCGSNALAIMPTPCNHKPDEAPRFVGAVLDEDAATTLANSCELIINDLVMMATQAGTSVDIMPVFDLVRRNQGLSSRELEVFDRALGVIQAFVLVLDAQWALTARGIVTRKALSDAYVSRDTSSMPVLEALARCVGDLRGVSQQATQHALPALMVQLEETHKMLERYASAFERCASVHIVSCKRMLEEKAVCWPQQPLEVISDEVHEKMAARLAGPAQVYKTTDGKTRIGGEAYDFQGATVSYVTANGNSMKHGNVLPHQCKAFTPWGSVPVTTQAAEEMLYADTCAPIFDKCFGADSMKIPPHKPAGDLDAHVRAAFDMCVGNDHKHLQVLLALVPFIGYWEDPAGNKHVVYTNPCDAMPGTCGTNSDVLKAVRGIALKCAMQHTGCDSMLGVLCNPHSDGRTHVFEAICVAEKQPKPLYEGMPLDLTQVQAVDAGRVASLCTNDARRHAVAYIFKTVYGNNANVPVRVDAMKFGMHHNKVMYAFRTNDDHPYNRVWPRPNQRTDDNDHDAMHVFVKAAAEQHLRPAALCGPQRAARTHRNVEIEFDSKTTRFNETRHDFVRYAFKPGTLCKFSFEHHCVHVLFQGRKTYVLHFASDGLESEMGWRVTSGSKLFDAPVRSMDDVQNKFAETYGADSADVTVTEAEFPAETQPVDEDAGEEDEEESTGTYAAARRFTELVCLHCCAGATLKWLLGEQSFEALEDYDASVCDGPGTKFLNQYNSFAMPRCSVQVPRVEERQYINDLHRPWFVMTKRNAQRWVPNERALHALGLLAFEITGHDRAEIAIQQKIPEVDDDPEDESPYAHLPCSFFKNGDTSKNGKVAQIGSTLRELMMKPMGPLPQDMTTPGLTDRYPTMPWMCTALLLAQNSLGSDQYVAERQTLWSLLPGAKRCTAPRALLKTMTKSLTAAFQQPVETAQGMSIAPVMLGTSRALVPMDASNVSNIMIWQQGQPSPALSVATTAVQNFMHKAAAKELEMKLAELQQKQEALLDKGIRQREEMEDLRKRLQRAESQQTEAMGEASQALAARDLAQQHAAAQKLQETTKASKELAELLQAAIGTSAANTAALADAQQQIAATDKEHSELQGRVTRARAKRPRPDPPSPNARVLRSKKH